MVRLVRIRVGTLAFCTALSAALRSGAQPRPALETPEPAGYIEGTLLVQVSRARGIALAKLESPGCRRLFADFRDIPGRTLDEILQDRQESPAQHLLRMVFRDGTDDPFCNRPGVYASTSPGKLTVFLCPSFRDVLRQEPRRAANLLIHEELHSLGAGEAPMPDLPSSREITTRVAEHCGP